MTYGETITVAVVTKEAEITPQVVLVEHLNMKQQSEED